MTSAIYLIGGPGVGKSTIMARLLDTWDVGRVFDFPHTYRGPCPCEPNSWGYKKWTSREMFGHIFQRPGEVGAYLGHLRSEYPGTDSLSLSVQPQAMLWLEALPTLGLSWVFGEGERLGNFAFLEGLGKATQLKLIHLIASPEIAEERRASRACKPVTPQYCLAKTKQAANLAHKLPGVREIDTNQPLEDIVTEILL